MNFHAGRPLRLELYGLAVAGSVVAVLLLDRMRLQEELLKEVLRQLPQRVVIQQNNQKVNVSREPTEIEVIEDVLRELRKKQ